MKLRDRIRASSKEYVGAPINEASGINPTTDTVELSFHSGEDPVTWTPGIWRTIQGQYHALAVVGPGSTLGSLAKGRYWVSVRVTDNPEIAVLTAPNQITIY